MPIEQMMANSRQAPVQKLSTLRKSTGLAIMVTTRRHYSAGTACAKPVEFAERRSQRRKPCLSARKRVM